MENSANGMHACSFCEYKSTRKSKIESHLRSHTGEKPFFCDKCKRGFSTSGDLKLHVQHVHLRVSRQRSKTYKCSLCPYTTPGQSTLESHILTHTRERSFPCKHADCNYSSRSSGGLKLHEIGKHSNERKFKCPFPSCGYRGKTKEAVNQHYVSHSESRPFRCDYEGCSYRAKKKIYIKNHKRGVHSGGYRPFECSMCNHSTTSRAGLSLHERIHYKEKPIKCNFSGCAYSCKSKSNLNKHVIWHHSGKTFKCDFAGCSSTAASRVLLEVHKKNVHCEKIYKCPSCHFRTKYLIPFRNHQERHNKNRQQTPCPHEGCTFRSKHQDSFKRHLASHEANLGCPEQGCGFAGRSSSSLKRHMEIHDPTGRPFPCPLCPKHFFKDNYLSQHLRTHTDEKPVQCPACHYASKTKWDVMKHVRAFHSTAFPEFGLDGESTCEHCHVNFGCAIGLAMHKLKLKTPIVLLTRLQLKLDL